MSLASRIADIVDRLASLERRVETATRHGTVTDVDAARQMVRLEIGRGRDGAVQKSPWVRYAQVAGALKLHSPPSVGQVMTLFSPGGEMRQGVAMPFTWSDENPSPSDDPDEHKLTIGDVEIRVKPDLVEVRKGAQVVEVYSDPPRTRVHFGGRPVVVLREKRLQVKLKPEADAPATYYILMDLEPLRFWMSDAPDIVKADPYPED